MEIAPQTRARSARYGCCFDATSTGEVNSPSGSNMENLGRPRYLRIVVVSLLTIGILGTSQVPATHAIAQSNWLAKLDPLLQARVSLTGRSRVVFQAVRPGAVSSVLALLPLLGGRIVRPLPIINGAAIDIPNLSLSLLAGNALVDHVSMDRVVAGANERTSATVGATAVRQQLGLDGNGI